MGYWHGSVKKKGLMHSQTPAFSLNRTNIPSRPQPREAGQKPRKIRSQQHRRRKLEFRSKIKEREREGNWSIGSWLVERERSKVDGIEKLREGLVSLRRQPSKREKGREVEGWGVVWTGDLGIKGVLIQFSSNLTRKRELGILINWGRVQGIPASVHSNE